MLLVDRCFTIINHFVCVHADDNAPVSYPAFSFPVLIVKILKMKRFIIPRITLLILFGGAVKALDLEGAKESPCFEIMKTELIDGNWFNKSSVWYYPAMSRLDLYYTALEVADQDAESLQENVVYYEGCVKFDRPNEFEVIGFADKRATYSFGPCNTTEDSEIQCDHFNSGHSGRGASTYVTLTDNSTFFFTASCWDDNEMTWAVSSPTKTLPTETIKLIHDHAESLGFKKAFFTGLQYDTCK